MRQPAKTMLIAALIVSVIAAWKGLTFWGWVLPSWVGGFISAGNDPDVNEGAQTFAMSFIYGYIVWVGTLLPLCLYAIWVYH